jgi:DNA repair protein RadC
MNKNTVLEIEKKLMELAELRSIYNVNNQKINSSQDCIDFLHAILEGINREEFAVICLNTLNMIITHEVLYKGCINRIPLRICEIFRPAILHDATSIIIAHNHPSGEVEFSFADFCMTEKIIEAGKLLEISVLDHILIGRQDCHLSMKEAKPDMFRI